MFDWLGAMLLACAVCAALVFVMHWFWEALS
jgi:hypothetical protein